MAQKSKFSCLCSGREYYLLTKFHVSMIYGLVCMIHFKAEEAEEEESSLSICVHHLPQNVSLMPN